ncbi:MAG: TonB-dependent receptor [Capsulimonadales bacterium]|nr:TonB-dependent receptor [Capsulimonadales bacterium]
MIRDRISSPIRPVVRLISIASAVSISLFAAEMARAQAEKPAGTNQPPAQDQAVPLPPDAESQLSGSRGNLLVIVQAVDSQTGQLVPAPSVVVRVESEFERPRYGVTDAEGKARLRLFAGRYKVVVTSAQYQRDEKFVDVNEAALAKDPAGGTFDVVNFILYDRIEFDKKIILYSLLDRTEVGNVYRRDQQFVNRFPVGIGNRQSLTKQLRSVPGLVEDSLNQLHARGENSVATATMLNGVLIPPSAVGRLSQVILPDALDEAVVRVGGLAPEYGGGSGAIYDLKTRRVSPSGRYLDFALRDGDYDTSDVYLNFGNTYPGFGKVAGRGPIRRFRYDISLSERVTNEVAEPPRDGYTNPANYGVSDVLFVNATFDLAQNKSISALGNFSTGRAGIATRQGFLSNFRPFGAGFGFLGERDFNGATATNPGNSASLPSQEDLNQDFRQKDDNSLIMLQARSQDVKGNEQRIAFGVSSSTLFQGNRAGTITLRQGQLPNDNSVEYLPTVLNDYQNIFVQADYSLAEPRSDANKTHRLKFGVVYHDLDGLDSYQFIPQSNLALNELFALDPRLAPSTIVNPEIAPTGRIDARGNVDFRTLTERVNYPVLFADRTGSYAAAYVQDTYKISNLFRINYGLRFDSFSQTTRISSTNPDYANQNQASRSASQNLLSPRVNVAYVSRYGPRLGGFLRPLDVLLKPLGFIFNERAILRVSYNRLFAPPSLGQGYFTANQRGTQASQAAADPRTFTVAPIPQVVDQLDLSVERQIGDFTVAKFGIYSKDLKDTLAMRSVLTPLQAGTISTLNLGGGVADGIEFGVETSPRFGNGNSLHAFLAFANSGTSPKDPNQFSNLAGSAGTRDPSDLEKIRSNFYEFDQANTLSGGVTYMFASGGSAGLSFVYGSGLYSSALSSLPNGTTIPANSANLANPVRTQSRKSWNEVNLRFATPPNFLYRQRDGRGIGIEFQVENLFDSLSVLNWRGPLAGTRYQLGRRFYLGLTGRL